MDQPMLIIIAVLSTALCAVMVAVVALVFASLALIFGIRPTLLR